MIKTTDIRTDYNKLIKEIAKIKKNPFVKVGFVRNIPHDSSGASQVMIAAVHEFGSSDGRIPKRSFIKSAVDKNKSDLRKQSQIGIDGIITRKYTVESFLRRMGLKIKGLIQERMVTRKTPKLKQATIDRKGSSNPLIDTGFLRQSVDFKVVLNPRGKRIKVPKGAK